MKNDKCKTCGSCRCDCQEVESRLETYLKNRNGQNLVVRMLEAAYISDYKAYLVTITNKAKVNK